MKYEIHYLDNDVMIYRHLTFLFEGHFVNISFTCSDVLGLCYRNEINAQ